MSHLNDLLKKSAKPALSIVNPEVEKRKHCLKWNVDAVVTPGNAEC